MAVGDEAVRQLQRLAASAGEHVSAISSRQRDWTQTTTESWARLQSELIHAGWPRVAELFRDYLIDAWQRGVLTADVLRQRGNIYEAHEAAGAPPVLCYEYETVMDGRSLKRPVNYMLLAIRPPEGVETHDWKRPYMIIDPRAGHGAGIGGFKPDSQVGVALHGGHPVYFVAFRQHPEPGQTIADVMRAEAAFFKEIVRRHPDAPQPAMVGNCQGGWATLLLAAADPTITGPIVINGAPLAAWSGVNGRNPMRYSGGLLGGALPVMLAADLGAGEFDGANLVMNFENLNPARSLFGKYYDLFADSRQGRRALPRIRAMVGRLLLPQRGGDPLDPRQHLHRQPAVARRGAARARPLDRSQGDPRADHRVREPRRQHHPAAAGAQLDRRHLRGRARDQDPRPAHHLHGARVGRPSRHLRVVVDRPQGAQRDRLRAQDHRDAGARPLRDDHRGAARRRPPRPLRGRLQGAHHGRRACAQLRRARRGGGFRRGRAAVRGGGGDLRPLGPAGGARIGNAGAGRDPAGAASDARAAPRPVGPGSGRRADRHARRGGAQGSTAGRHGQSVPPRRDAVGRRGRAELRLLSRRARRLVRDGLLRPLRQPADAAGGGDRTTSGAH